jgi:DNA mismatch repair protein MutL
MNRDDLLLCIERHATSKIRTLADLFSVDTLGFRGEALPSIASVSRLEITTRPAEQLSAHRLKIVGGSLKSIEERGAPSGTIVEVRDLFFNVPARRKFLRSIRAETDQIIDTLSRIALPFKHIHFRLEDGDKTLLSVPSTADLQGRLAALLGRKVVSSMVERHEEAGGLKLVCYAGSPEWSRSRGDRILVYVNGRNIRDRVVGKAVLEGYGQRLMKGRYPQVVVLLDLAPGLVDMNVHPGKQEVRFHKGNLVYRTVQYAIERALGRRTPSEEGLAPRPRTGTAGTAGTQLEIGEPRWAYVGPREEPFQHQEAAPEPPAPEREGLRVIGGLRDTYILCQGRDGLVMVDQHAAHERIMYERLKEAHGGRPLERQAFLIPQEIEFPLKEARVLLKHLEALQAMGLELEHFGGNSFLLRSVPSFLTGAAWDRLLADMIPLLEEERDWTDLKALDELWTVMACHGAIRAGQRLSREEMSSLLAQLEGTQVPGHCPHGRPVFRKISYDEIERMFKRVV